MTQLLDQWPTAEETKLDTKLIGCAQRSVYMQPDSLILRSIRLLHFAYTTDFY